MSTRAIIGRVNDDGSDGWKGRYHHWDGYPRGLGQRLWELWLTHFKGDTAAMTKFLIDDHPAGWSSLLVCDMTKPAGFREMGVVHPGEPQKDDFRDSNAYWDAHRVWEAEQGPQCYCHGDRQESASALETSEQGADTWCEYAYIFNEKTNRMFIFLHAQSAWHFVTSIAYEDNVLDGFWEAVEEKCGKMIDRRYGEATDDDVAEADAALREFHKTEADYAD